VGLGETGSDLTATCACRPCCIWDLCQEELHQMQFLESMLLISKDLQRMPPIVLHCWDARKRPKVYEGRAANLVLELLRQPELTNVKIHQHCLIGSAEELRLWTSSLPNCYLVSLLLRKMNAWVQNFNEHSLTFLSTEFYCKLMCCTSNLTHSFGMPWLIMSTAETIARVCRIPPWVLVQITDINAQHFYKLP
jgi:Tat protein secretion system quality control protein TatD with DNase activity